MTSRRRFLGPIAAALVAVALATAAGGQAAPRASAPASWAKQVCGAVGSWLDTLDRRASAASGATSPKAAKSSLTKLLTGADAATKTVIKKVRKAGTPSVPGGSDIAKNAREQFQQVEKTIAQARKTLAKAKSGDVAKLVVTARNAQDGLEAGLESVQAALASASTADAPPLLPAAAAESSCERAVENDASPTVTLDPPQGAPGAEVTVTPSGVDEAAVQQCYGSSAFATEFLGADGTRLGTGEDVIAVPASATPGRATIRLVCYLPDESGRRVIHSLCAPFTVTGGAATQGAAPSATSCPPTPRLVLSQGVLAGEAALSEGFNPVLTALGG